ncbi:phage tail tape measure protein [Paucisalibacillus globulus]|uniref:phage tail tape measure protein n=1 Tax=Paucisalibacillus globulus TaxID=351095 RepID=UPI0004087F76|nr:phage tail tape measure protein [Paucisalibacillus globulus]
MATKDVGNLRTRLSWEDDGTTRSLTRFREDLKGLRSEMRTVTSQGKEYKNGLKGLREQSDILSRQLRTQKERVEELRRRYQESASVKGEDAKQTRDLAAQYNNAVSEMNKTENQLNKVTQAINNQINPLKRLSDNLNAAGQKMQSVGKGMTDFGKNYSMKVTAPIVAGGTAVFKASMDFESAFAGVAKTFSGTEQQLADLRVGIRDMAKEIPASTTEISAVAEAAGQLGIQTESIEEFTRTMIDLGEATNMTADQAATEFARFANIVGMSQQDFDNMGSSVVALGNSMATTEAEISSMAMRLAAQGSQIGMTESQILALSATMSSLGIEAEAGGTAMTTVLKKIDYAVGESGKELKGFAKAAGVSSGDFAKAWNKDPVKALDLFIKGLAQSSSEGANLTSILEDLGIKGIRESDTILRLAGASDLLTDAVNTSTKAWEENTALSDEAAQRYATTESQLKIMWNRVKDVAITLGDSLAPAVMDAIDAAEPWIKQIESGAKAFSELDEEQQRNILKLIAWAAAIGPVSIGLGGLTSTIGGVVKIGGSLTGMLGKVGGAGLLGRIGAMSATAGPVGLAIGGVALLGTTIWALSDAANQSIEDTYNSIQARKDEIDQLDELISQYETLQNKNMLSTDEILRYMDIMDELKSAKSEEAIKALKDEQEKLLEKSTLTNEEMEQFLELNDKVIKKSPSTVSAISEHGNAYAGVLDELKQLNEYERQRLTQDTYREITNEMRNQEENLKKQKDLQGEIKQLESDREEAFRNLVTHNERLGELDAEIAKLRNDELNPASEELLELTRQTLKERESEKAILEGIIEGENITIGKLEKKIAKKQDSLTKTEKELELYNDLLDDYAQMVLFEQGITSEKGKHLEALKLEQKNIDENRLKLEEMKTSGKLVGSAYEVQNQRLNEQQSKLDEAILKLEQMNITAGQTVYQTIRQTVETFYSKPSGYQPALNRDPVAISAYAVGTDFHPGGPALVGEEGYELAKLGNRWSMLRFGITDLPRGTQVFTHDESKRILAAMNRIPAYADGINPYGEGNRIVNQLNGSIKSGQTINQTVNIYSPTPLTPSETARLQKQASRQLAMEWS